MGQAAGALVIADGAAWIWRLAGDRFPGARQRLDFHHAVPHLAAVGRAVCGEDQARLKAGLKPLVHQLKNESAVKVIRQLEEVLATLPAGVPATTVQAEVNYFHEHQARMDCRAGRRRGEPLGSGASEATLPPASMPLQAPGSVLEPRRRRSVAVPGNSLAQRPPAPALPSRPALQPLKKLRCAP